jgi:c-di-GMP-binding flagellar brake protein YcgR
MAKQDTRKERRSSRRVDAQLALQLSGRAQGAKPILAESLNISTGGVYCLVKHEVPVLTVLDLSIQLPKFGANRSTQVVHCEGVVVRCEKSPKSTGATVRYDLACAFQEMDEETRGLVNEFVLWKLLSAGSGRSG